MLCARVPGRNPLAEEGKHACGRDVSDNLFALEVGRLDKKEGSVVNEGARVAAVWRAGLDVLIELALGVHRGLLRGAALDAEESHLTMSDACELREAHDIQADVESLVGVMNKARISEASACDVITVSAQMTLAVRRDSQSAGNERHDDLNWVPAVATPQRPDARERVRIDRIVARGVDAGAEEQPAVGACEHERTELAHDR